VKTIQIIALFAISLLLASCGSGSALREYTKGDLLASYDFTNAATFEEGAYRAATLQVIDGAYQIDILEADNVLWWGQWGETYDDVIIDVDTFQESEANGNAYGVMCRVQGTIGQAQEVDPTLAAIMQDSTAEPTAAAEATAEGTAEATAESTDEAAADATAEAEATAEATAESSVSTAAPLLTATPQPPAPALSNGDGYLFLIQGGGSFSIMRSRGRNLTPLVNWTGSDAIRQGPSANHIRAICAGNYLALYVNDVFLGDATDDNYARGQVGLGASSASRAGTRIDFDNLTISAAVPK
jgi:hypothetical protein